MRRILPLVGASCCCLVLGITAANAETVTLSDAELDHVVAGNISFPPFEPIGSPPSGGGAAPPPPLFVPDTDAPFDLNVGLLNPPAPPPPLTPPTPTPTPTPTPPNGGDSQPPAPTPTFRDQLADFRIGLRSRF